ncbi:hypothetical protein ABC955_04950 [Citromicrobium bathyomarinum]
MTAKIINLICVLVSVAIFSLTAWISLHFGLLGKGLGIIAMICGNGILLIAPLSLFRFSRVGFYLLVALQVAMFLYLGL